jgi:RNA polymerase sigma-70 factor (ECF subfamily)
MPADSFHDDLIALLPRLRVQALALTRNRAMADDLLQEAVVKALAARDSFAAGTNMAAWMSRIVRNTFISDLRRRRETVDIDDAGTSVPGTGPDAEDRLVLKEVWTAMGELAPAQREALVMVAVEGMSYEAVAAATGVAVGTAKCRVFRARNQLHAMLVGTDQAATPRPRLAARSVHSRAVVETAPQGVNPPPA